MPESPKKNFFMKLKQQTRFVSKVANDNHPPHNIAWGWIVVIFFIIMALLLIFY